MFSPPSPLPNKPVIQMCLVDNTPALCATDSRSGRGSEYGHGVHEAFVLRIRSIVLCALDDLSGIQDVLFLTYERDNG